MQPASVTSSCADSFRIKLAGAHRPQVGSDRLHMRVPFSAVTPAAQEWDESHSGGPSGDVETGTLSHSDGRICRLGDIPHDWPVLPANKSLSTEVGLPPENQKSDRPPYAPIKVHGVTPHGGGRRLHFGFFHANHPDGVRNKAYELSMFERGHTFLQTRSDRHDPPSYLQIYEISADWLRRRFPGAAAAADSNLQTWLDRCR